NVAALSPAEDGSDGDVGDGNLDNTLPADVTVDIITEGESDAPLISGDIDREGGVPGETDAEATVNLTRAFRDVTLPDLGDTVDNTTENLGDTVTNVTESTGDTVSNLTENAGDTLNTFARTTGDTVTNI